jgi:hypothetical protein
MATTKETKIMVKLIKVNDADKAVAQLLKDNKIAYSVRFAGSVNSGQWQHDRFVVTIGSCDFEYSTGFGYRLQVNENAYKLSQSQIDSVKTLRDLLGLDRLDQTIIDIGTKCYAVKPTQASVLYCLLSDANCGSMSFDDFCAELGYNPDSINDFKIYQKCMETRQKINKIFNNEQLQQLTELLQDY